VGDPPRAPSEWAESWQRSWDRLEEGLVPDRERQIRLLDVVEAIAGTALPSSTSRVALARSPADCSIGCHGHARSLSTSIRCYDRRRDPRETANLAGRSEHAAVERELRDRLLRWLFETADIVPARRDPRLDDDLQQATFGT
jgi:hypothetical protein